MGNVHVQQTIAINVGRVNPHPGLVAAVLTGSQTGDQGDISKGPIVVILKEKVGPCVVRDSDIRPAVAIKVSEHNTHAFRLRHTHTGFDAHVSEGSVVVVVVEFCLLPSIRVRIAIGTIAWLPLTAVDIVLRTPIEVVSHNEIQPAVLVVVEPAGAGGPCTFVGHASFVGHIAKGAITVVMIEDCSAVPSDIEIRIAVIIEIRDSHALSVVSFTAETGSVSNIRKRSI